MLVVSLTLTLDDTWDEYDEISKELLCEDIMEHFHGLGCYGMTHWLYAKFLITRWAQITGTLDEYWYI